MHIRGSIKALVRLIEALLRLYQGSFEVLWRLYYVSINALFRVYLVFIKALSRLYEVSDSGSRKVETLLKI